MGDGKLETWMPQCSTGATSSTSGITLPPMGGVHARAAAAAFLAPSLSASGHEVGPLGDPANHQGAEGDFTS